MSSSSLRGTRLPLDRGRRWVLLLTALTAALGAAGCPRGGGGRPDDARLRRVVEQQEPVLLQLAGMAREDGLHARITCDRAEPPGLAPARLEAYCRHLKAVGAAAGLAAEADRVSIVFWAGRRRARGLAHLEPAAEQALRAQGHVVDRLDAEDRPGAWYAHVKGPWYVFLDNGEGRRGE